MVWTSGLRTPHDLKGGRLRRIVGSLAGAQEVPILRTKIFTARIGQCLGFEFIFRGLTQGVAHDLLHGSLEEVWDANVLLQWLHTIATSFHTWSVVVRHGIECARPSYWCLDTQVTYI